MTKNHREIIIDRYLDHRAIKHLYNFDKRVFAYQVLTENITKIKENNRPKEERHWVIAKNEALHDSIITSIKALDMEKRSRIEHHNNRPYNRYYTFHILSIFDGDMIQSHLDKDGEIDSAEITHINYLNRHIVNKVDDFYIVNFIKKDIFDYRLKLFDYLHQENARTLPQLIKSFYEDVFDDRCKVQIFWREFSDSIIWKIRSILIENGAITNSEDVNLSYIYNKKEKLLEIGVDLSFILPQDEVEKLNTNMSLIDVTQRCLKNIYRYTDNFTFTDGVPF